MINILFALIAIGAMCIDIILNRGLVDEIEDEKKEQTNKLERLFKELKLPKATTYAKNCRDKIELLTNRLLIEVKNGCASRNARPFYVYIVFLAISIVISAAMEIGYENTTNEGGFFRSCLYPMMGGMGTILWLFILGFFVWRLCRMLAFNNKIEQSRASIRSNVEQTIVNARLLVGDPTTPLDI